MGRRESELRDPAMQVVAIIRLEADVRELKDEVKDVQAQLSDSDRRIPVARTADPDATYERGFEIDYAESPTGSHRIVSTHEFERMYRALQREQDGRTWRSIKRAVKKHIGKAILIVLTATLTHELHHYFGDGVKQGQSEHR